MGFSCFVQTSLKGLETNKLFYADDSKFYADCSIPGAAEALQRDLNRVTDWTINTGMRFNKQSCKKVVFGVQPGTRLELCRSELQEAEFEKDLGVVMSNDLKFQRHAIHTLQKTWALFHLYRRALRNRHPSVMLKIFNMYLVPTLLFGVTVWWQGTASVFKEFEKLERAFWRLSPWGRHPQALAIADHIYKLSMCYIHRVYHKLSPINIDEVMPPLEHGLYTRSLTHRRVAHF